MCHNSEEETTDRLFFNCPAAASRWFALGIVWEENLSAHQKILQARLDFGQPFFMEVFMIGAWCLWKQRNDVIFEGKPHTLLLGRLFSKRLSWIISVELSQISTPRSNSGFVLCNLFCGVALLLSCSPSSLPLLCNLLLLVSPPRCLTTGWVGCKSFFVTLF
jgi:hypothetical protein